MKNGPGSINRIYRLVWNERTGTFVAVPEGTRGRGKRSSGVAGALLAAGLAASGLSWAADPAPPNTLPQGGNVVSGQAALNAQGSRLDITQGSNRAAINWQSFNVGSQAQVKIQQPDARSVLLNRVIGADPSAIYGRLSANGQVLLVNPNGIVFGKGSQVDVGGIVASTLNIDDADFNTGRLNFKRSGNAGSIFNEGRISAAAGGYVA
ncbi:MAG TPA: filamentous hemagglutinin N-terminal domain-containing protein, partial [Burkholderiaceae bacterium]|nr:filamentous hemagglutinin N-terminal domain-containing protein [Burkholderiaceae bacterium]